MRSQRVKRVKRSKKSKMSKRKQINRRTKRSKRTKRSRRKQINRKRSRIMRGGMEATERTQREDWRSGETSTTVGKRRLANEFLIQSGFKKENLCDLYNSFFYYISKTDVKNYSEFKSLFNQKYGQPEDHHFGDALKYWYDVQIELLPYPIYKDRILDLKQNLNKLLQGEELKGLCTKIQETFELPEELITGQPIEILGMLQRIPEI